jgi:nicotinate-nucleotide pyrophosphorylase
MATVSKAVLIHQYQTLASGLASAAPNGVYAFEGQVYTTAQVGALITEFLGVVSAVASTKATWVESIQKEKQAQATTGKTLSGLREVIGMAFANSPATLQSLGIAPRKAPTPLSAEARAASTAKAEATRKARGTTSKKQKAEVSGNVTGVTITPVIAPTATPSPAGTSAPVTPPAAVPAGGGTARS